MTTPSTSPKAPQTPSQSAKTEWEFTADFDVGLPPPEAPRVTRSTELPFAAKFFSPAMQAALEGKQPHKFIPKAFFTGRADKPEKVDGSYMKTKVREAFNKWLKLQAQPVREALAILQVERKGDEGDYKEPGVSVWIVTAKPKKAPPAV